LKLNGFVSNCSTNGIALPLSETFGNRCPENPAKFRLVLQNFVHSCKNCFLYIFKKNRKVRQLENESAAKLIPKLVFKQKEKIIKIHYV